MTVTEHVVRTNGHTTFFLAAGPEDGPPVILVHGWPELSHSWRHQLACLGGLGFRAIAPDMRGYGRSSVYDRHEDYGLRPIVGDLIGLADALDIDRAVWVGHDWGAPAVWSLAAHHPARCHGVANLCVPYGALDRGLEPALPLIDRSVYPEAEFPVGQWEYQRFYEENFAAAIAPFDADPYRAVKALFRSGSAKGLGQASRTAFVRRDGGWFGGADLPPDVPRDAAVVSEADLSVYAAALARTGFFGPSSWYMNHAANAAYAESAAGGGRLAMPVLFLAARYDYTCESVDSRLGEPMRALCADLTERVIASGHWMAQEQPVAVNAALVGWLATRLPQVWP
ncbi:MAG: alpha/beta hydrolase [Alphaproteobacteria bacterium]|nr:alpha/beta hydrolase [Alphaproteobacteria bacterium]MCB9931635.1 alpha/beta hydrolase [Alphaproteobacteria bacterium]